MSKSKSTRTWNFSIICKTYPGESVCVSGDCSRLGHWKHDKPLVLEKDPTSSEEAPVWTGQAQLPLRDVRFRYFVCMILENPVHGERNVFIMRRWETNINPRISHKNEAQTDEGSPDDFAVYDGQEKMEHGWLTAESVVQFKVSNGPIRFWRKKHANGTVRIKVVPINLARQSSSCEIPDANGTDIQDSSSAYNGSNVAWPLIEVAAIGDDENQFALQDQFGRVYKGVEILVFQAQILEVEGVAYMMDFYMDNPGADAPSHIGFCHILPVNLKDSMGSMVLPITSMRQESIGHIMIEYVVIRPLPNCPCDLSVSYSKHWKYAWTGLDIGHRGSGNSQKKFQQCSNMRENTIASLQQAAEHGADFVEFDVQLSKDLVPVLFHDFHVSIGLNQKAKKGSGLTTLRIPVKDLTLNQLHELKIYHVNEEPTEDPTESDLVEPFPTLQFALESVPTYVGFNVEIKWTMQLKDGTYELDYPFELNMFLDIVLQTVLNHAGNRRIVFSSFNPDICSMIRLKQNKYPVLFLTQGTTQKYPEYNDPRTQSTLTAINFAVFSGILGLNMHTEDILRDPSLVAKARSHGLVTFCWGDDNNCAGTIKYLKELGLNGVIYDRIELHLNEKQSIFLTDDGEDFLQIAAALSPRSPGSASFHNEDSRSHLDSSGLAEDEGVSPVNGSLQNGEESGPRFF